MSSEPTSETVSASTLASKGFDARQARGVVLTETGGAEFLSRLDEAIQFEKHAFAIGGRTRDCVALFNQNVALLQQQKDELIEGSRVGLINSLRRGAVVAFGYVPPVAPGDHRRVIDPALWDVLALDYETSSARGGRLEYVGVRIIKVDVLSEEERRAIKDTLRQGRKRTAPEAPAPGFPGRPTVMKAIREQMRRRAARGELLESLAKESRDLAAWADSKYPDHQTPKAKSIYNALASAYRSLKEAKPTGN